MNLQNFKTYLQVCLTSTMHHLEYTKYNYLQESTIHGIRYFVDGENLFHRIVWMILVGCSVSLLAFLIYDANKYVVSFYKMCSEQGPKRNVEKLKNLKV